MHPARPGRMQGVDLAVQPLVAAPALRLPDPADADACLPDPGACEPVPAVPSGGPMLRVLLALALGLVMIVVGPRKRADAA